MNGITLEKKPYLCSCKSSELAGAMTLLREVKDQEMAEIFSPYQGSQTTVVVKSSEVESIVDYLRTTREVGQVFIDANVVKAFTEDSLVTYLAVKKDNQYELYRSQDDPAYMW